ncbi:MAG: DUF58 domain-containing protein [Bdellovibrionales bacterium]|nr:DUF58 domain-containing protein [Bdellovibrionales bacterium]
MNLKEIERVVGMIQSHIFKNSNAYATGMLKSHFRGSGLQFREHQVYVPGDDVRFIDWKLSARSDHTYIKTFEEERNVEIVVFLDLSQTLFYGYNQVSKLQALIEIIALLYLLAGETHDAIRVIIWAEKTVNLPPKKGKEGLTLFISMLERLGVIDDGGRVVVPKKEMPNNLPELGKIAQIKSFLAKRKEVIYLGDMSLVKDKSLWDKVLDKKHMHCFRIFSPIDKNSNLPFLFKTKSPLTGKAMVTDLKSRDEEAMFKKERFKEIGVHERYLEKFVRELV